MSFRINITLYVFLTVSTSGLSRNSLATQCGQPESITGECQAEYTTEIYEHTSDGSGSDDITVMASTSTTVKASTSTATGEPSNGNVTVVDSPRKIFRKYLFHHLGILGNFAAIQAKHWKVLFYSSFQL